MTWFDSTTPYARRAMPATTPTSRSVADRLSYTQGVGGSIPSSSTVAEVEVVDTPGRGPGGSRFESGRSPHIAAARRGEGSGDQRGFIRLARGFDSRPRDHRNTHLGRWRNWKR